MLTRGTHQKRAHQQTTAMTTEQGRDIRLGARNLRSAFLMKQKPTLKIATKAGYYLLLPSERRCVVNGLNGHDAPIKTS